MIGYGWRQMKEDELEYGERVAVSLWTENNSLGRSLTRDEWEGWNK
jgi:hypothetical protein